MSIEVHGYKSTGPVYSIRTYRPGRRFRRNRYATSLVGTRGGRNIGRPAHQFVFHDNRDYLILNKGHEYELVTVVEGPEGGVDGELLVHHDARKSYGVIEIPQGIGILEVREFVDEDEPSTEGNQSATTDESEKSTPPAEPDAGDIEDEPSGDREEVASEEE